MSRFSTPLILLIFLCAMPLAINAQGVARGVYYLSLDGEQVMERPKFVKE
jgi:hypothetical protein